MSLKRGRPKKRPIVIDTSVDVFFCQICSQEVHIRQEDGHWVRDEDGRTIRLCEECYQKMKHKVRLLK